MKKGKLSIYLLSSLFFIPFITATNEGFCFVEKEILNIEDDLTLWDDDYYDDFDSHTKLISYKYSVECKNITLNPEQPILSQITGMNKEKANLSIVLILTNSKLTTVSANIFKNMTFVVKLHMINSGISSIEPEALDMPLLTTIHLEYNNLTEIKEGTFKKLISLSQLYLQHNKIKVLENFQRCRNLENVRLENNNIASITSQFQNLSMLRYLNLANNSISKIDPNAFLNVHQLRSLYLQNNKLETFPSELLKGLELLNLLDLSDNYLKEISFEYYLDKIWNQGWWVTNIAGLNLSNNKLTSVPTNLTNVHDLAKTFKLNNNSITNISASDFSNLNMTKYLDLSHNKINSIDIGSFRELTRLQTLDLSFNNISELKLGVFSGLNEVNSLNLSYNQLIHFDSTVFFTMISLNEISFQGNYLHSLNTSEFHFHNLRYISLDFYNISCHSLTHYIKAFKSHSITVRSGSTFLTENINGIACIHTTKLIRTSTTTVIPVPITISSTIPAKNEPITQSTPEISTDVTVTTETAKEITGKSEDLKQASKTGHTFLIITIVLLLALVCGVGIWLGKKYYFQRRNGSDESQYRLVNIMEGSDILR